MQRTGKKSKDIFASTTKEPAAPMTVPSGTTATTKPVRPAPMPAAELGMGRGRPPVHEEPWKKITTVLLDRQVVYLDRLSNDIRATTGAVVKRTEIIRALIDALTEADLDGLSSVRSEADLRALVVGRMGGGKG